MLKKPMRMLALAVTTLITVSSFTGFTSMKAKSTPPPPVTLQFFIPPSTAPNNIDAVMAEFEKRTKDTLNTKIVLNYVDWGDLGSKVTVKLAAGEQVDAAFAAQWTTPSIQQDVSKGLFKNLDSYFNNSKYPGLKTAFDKAFLTNNSFTDANNQNHIYGIPFSHSFTGVGCLDYRLDLATKYGIGQIKNLSDMTRYFDAILKNNNGMVPLSWLGTNDNLASTLQGWYGSVRPKKHNYDSTQAGQAFAIRANGTAYVAKHIIPSLDPEYKKLLPADVQKVDPLLGYKIARDWYVKGYTEKDILSQKDARAMFRAGNAAAVMSNLDTYNADKVALESAIPGAKMGYFIPDPNMASDLNGNVGTNFQAWNFMCIPVTSKNADRTMAFFNWIFSSQSNHDLMENGIEGQDWVPVGKDKIAIPAGKDPNKVYNLVGFQLTWSPNMQRYAAATPTQVIKKMNEAASTKWFYKLPSSGFSFVSDNVKTEQAKVNDLAALLRAAGCGVVADYKSYIEDVNKKFISAGNPAIQAEFSKQINEFLKSHPYQGQ